MGQIKELAWMLGKQVTVKNCLKVCYTDKLSDISGKLTFIGSNDYLGWPLQVTIERMPIQLKNLTQLELKENEN